VPRHPERLTIAAVSVLPTWVPATMTRIGAVLSEPRALELYRTVERELVGAQRTLRGANDSKLRVM
jgi:hypothetical protein